MSAAEWIALGVAIGVTSTALGLLVFAAVRTLSRGHRAEADAAPPPLQAAGLDDPFLARMDRLARLAREVDGQLDRRLAELNQALDRADETLRQLQALPAAADRPQPQPSAADHDDRPIPEVAADPAPADEDPEQARYVSDAPAQERLSEAARLAAKGLDDREIARRTHLPIGQVQLIRNLGRLQNPAAD